MNPSYSFTLRASTGETFTVLHFPGRGEFRRFETTDGERVEGGIGAGRWRAYLHALLGASGKVED